MYELKKPLKTQCVYELILTVTIEPLLSELKENMHYKAQMMANLTL